jgi:phage gp29-like protein
MWTAMVGGAGRAQMKVSTGCTVKPIGCVTDTCELDSNNATSAGDEMNGSDVDWCDTGERAGILAGRIASAPAGKKVSAAVTENCWAFVDVTS